VLFLISVSSGEGPSGPSAEPNGAGRLPFRRAPPGLRVRAREPSGAPRVVQGEMTRANESGEVPVLAAAVTKVRMVPRTEPERPAVDPAAALAHADALHNLARYLVRTEADAEDLVQETYARAFAAAGRFEPGTNLKAWLFRILRNLFLDRLRRDRRATEPLDEDAPAEAGDDAWLRGDVELEAMRRLVGAEIEGALRALSEEARTTVLLDVEGFTEPEMAQVLGCAPGTVKSRLSRARATLRRRLAEYARRESP